jgi:hypothetical protein
MEKGETRRHANHLSQGFVGIRSAQSALVVSVTFVYYIDDSNRVTWSLLPYPTPRFMNFKQVHGTVAAV